MAASRFSGRRAPERPGADKITKEAYSHEVQSVGWWPGGGDVTSPMFYSYCAPEPPGFRESAVRPGKAFYDTKLGEFLLSYDEVRAASDPRAALLDFCQSTYEAAAVSAQMGPRISRTQACVTLAFRSHCALAIVANIVLDTLSLHVPR